MKILYTIKQVSEKVGLSQPTIRGICDAGLIPHFHMGENKERVFNDESVKELVKLIDNGKGGE